MRTIKAIGRLISSIFLVIIGKADRRSAKIAKTPDAMRGGYNEVIRDKTKLAVQLTEGISIKISSRAGKIARLEAFQEQSKTLRNAQAGALSLAKKRSEELGDDAETLAQDEKYKSYRQAYTNKENAIKSLEGRMEELENSIEEDTATIEDQKTRLLEMKSELQSLVDEREDAVADVISSKADQIANAALADIPSDDNTVERLRKLREARRSSKADAQVVRELAQTDAQSFDAALLREGRVDEAATAFDAMVMGVEQTETVTGADALQIDATDGNLSIHDKDEAEVSVGEDAKS